LVIAASGPAAHPKLLAQALATSTATAQDEKKTLDQRQSGLFVIGYAMAESLAQGLHVPEDALQTSLGTLQSFAAPGINNALSMAACQTLGGIGRVISLAPDNADKILSLIKKTNDPKVCEAFLIFPF